MEGAIIPGFAAAGGEWGGSRVTIDNRAIFQGKEVALFQENRGGGGMVQ